MGTIYKRNNVFWIQYYRNGKPYRESTKSDKETEAKKLLRQREGEISEGKLPGVYFDRVRFDELAEDLLRDYRVNGRRSLKRVMLSVAHLQETFSGMRVTNIDTPHIQGYVEKRRQADAANGTINRELAALKRMLNLGANQTPPKVNRVPYIPMLKENNVRKGFFEHSDFCDLRDALPGYLKAFTTFAYKTGWRVSEIESLTWNQVDLEQGIVRIEGDQTKNSEARTVYLDEELKGMFDILYESRDSLIPYIFIGRNGRDKVREFKRAWRTACDKAKLGKRLFHDLRRTAVRNMVRAGTPERVSMMISGHKTRSVFDRYNIVSDADLKMAAKQQEQYLQKQAKHKTSTIVNLEERRARQNDN